MSELKQKQDTQPNKIGQATGKLGTYHKAPPMDKNAVAGQKGTSPGLNQMGFKKGG